MTTQDLGIIAPVPRDDWDNETTYNTLNIVRYNNSVYMAKQASVGVVPTNAQYWMKLIDIVDIPVATDIIYPVGSIYMSTVPTNPEILFGGTWEELPADKCLQTVATTGTAGIKIAAGLPNITGQIGMGGNSALFLSSTTSGAFSNVGATNLNYGASGSSSTGDRTATVEFSAQNSNSIYGNSDTVQPPAYTIYAWRRTA